MSKNLPVIDVFMDFDETIVPKNPTNPINFIGSKILMILAFQNGLQKRSSKNIQTKSKLDFIF